MTQSLDRNYELLVAEADHDTCRTVQGALDRHGHNVTCCHDGEEAWNIIRSGRCNLAIVDIDLPGIDGFEILSRCHRGADLTDLPVIVLSDADEDEVFERAFALGAKACIAKPVRVPLVAHAVWQVLRNCAREEELRWLKDRLGIETNRQLDMAS